MNTGWKDEQWTGLSRSPDQTVAVGRALGGLAKSGDLIGLIGELGAGKTQLVRGLASALGAPEAAVASPTFVLIHEYPIRRGAVRLVHVDAYRVSSLDELESIGWDPAAGGGELRQDAVLVVEWADRLAGALGDDWLEVRLDHVGRELRRLTVRPHGQWIGRATTWAPTLDRAISAGPKPVGRCPTCKKAVEEGGPFFPFCSDRCKTIDLGRWAGEEYRISRPLEQADLDEGE